MTRTKYTLAIVALLAMGAADVAAQRAGFLQERRGWLGFSYDPTTLRVDGERRPGLVVIEVMENSPAESAGLLVGDTIFAINDLRVTESFMQSLGSTLENGDVVRVRVRSRNRDRTLNMSAATRPAGMIERRPFDEVSAGEVRERVRILLDSARIFMDTTMLRPRFRVEELPGGGAVYMFGDSSVRVRRFPFDSTWSGARGGGGGVWLFTPDSVNFHGDTTFFRALPRVRAGGRGGAVFGPDSLLRLRMDTLAGVLRAMPGGRIYGLNGDSLWTFQPGDSRAFSGISVFGMRAVGGAELTELNPGLGEYFGTEEGVLVVRVPAGTPAERAGLAAGDVITAVNGQVVESVGQLNRTIAERGRGSIRLEVLRKKQRRTIELRDD